MSRGQRSADRLRQWSVRQVHRLRQRVLRLPAFRHAHRRPFFHDLWADLGGRDIALYAAGLTFYAAIALIPLFMVALWIASTILGHNELRHFVDQVGRAVPHHGLNNALHVLAGKASRLSVAAAITTTFVATLYGEGLGRALDHVACRPPRWGKGLRGRLLGPVLVVVAGLLSTVGLLAIARLAILTSQGGGATVGGVIAAFAVDWVGCTLALWVTYSVFGPERPKLRGLLRGGGLAGVYLSALTLVFLRILALPLDFGKPFAGNLQIGLCTIVGFWLYLSHFGLLLGYVIALRLSDGPRVPRFGSMVKPSGEVGLTGVGDGRVKRDVHAVRQ